MLRGFLNDAIFRQHLECLRKFGQLTALHEQSDPFQAMGVEMQFFRIRHLYRFPHPVELPTEILAGSQCHLTGDLHIAQNTIDEAFPVK